MIKNWQLLRSRMVEWFISSSRSLYRFTVYRLKKSLQRSIINNTVNRYNFTIREGKFARPFFPWKPTRFRRGVKVSRNEVVKVHLERKGRDIGTEISSSSLSHHISQRESTIDYLWGNTTGEFLFSLCLTPLGCCKRRKELFTAT